MPKRGRPRIHRPQVDLGTPELRAKRLALTGPPRAGWPKPDVNAGESVLGTLLWQGFLHGDYSHAKRMYDAGVMFAGWWVLVYPTTFTLSALGRLQPCSTVPVDREAAEADLKSACAFLGKERVVLDAVVNVCVYQRMNLRQLEKLRTGLCRLIEWHKQKRRAAAA